MLKIDLFEVIISFLSETTASLKMLEMITLAWVHVGGACLHREMIAFVSKMLLQTRWENTINHILETTKKSISHTF